MFVDASAMCAVLLAEADADAFAGKLAAAAHRRTSPVAVFETVLAVSKWIGGDMTLARSKVTEFLRIADIELSAIGMAELALALDAHERYGKGRHPARLNMGDCFAYACAKTQGAPLLFKGDDFSKTDVAIA
jgi:ribonuclease VapC